MKNILLFIFTITLVGLQSQNWLPIDTSKVYHFDHNEDSLIDKSIKAVQNHDTIFFDLIVDSCYCTDVNWPFRNNMPDFLGKYLINDNDTSFTFYGHDTIVVKTNKQIGDTWNFGLSKIATIVSIEETVIGNINDSIQTIWLGSFDTLVISKNYGLIQYPYFFKNKTYKQIGINNLYGVQELKNFEIYDFNVGDIFQYRRHSGNSDNGVLRDEIKKTILSKLIDNDTVIYVMDVQVRYEEKEFQAGSSYPRIFFRYEHLQDTIKYIYNNDFYALAGNWTIAQENQTSSPIYFVPFYYFDQKGILTLEYDIPFVLDNNGFMICDSIYCIITVFERQIILKEGLGLTSDEGSYFESVKDLKLIGYYKGVDTVGVIYNDEFYTKVNDQVNIRNLINYYPNPTNQYLQVEIKHNEQVQIEIYDYLGKVQLSQVLDQNTILDVSHLSKGTYSIQVCVPNNNCGSEQLVVK